MMKKTVMMVAAAMGPMRPLRNFQVPASLRHTLIVRLRGSAP